MNRRWIARVAALALATGTAATLAGCAQGGVQGAGNDTAASSGTLDGKVYFILPDRTTVRFEQFDKPDFTAAMKAVAPNMQVVTLNSENSVTQQLNQVQTAITAGAKAIVMVAVDPDQAAGSLSAAAAAKIPVICDSHACNGGTAYAYQIAKFLEIGQTHGAKLAEDAEKYYSETGKPLRLAKMYGDPKYPFYVDQVKGIGEKIDPLISAGKIKVVCQADALNWLPNNSQQAMDQCLTKTNNGVDAILTMNDDLGGGALAAATSAGLKNVKLYGGYDASLAGIQRVAAGIQPLDMSINYKTFNASIADLVVAAVKGEKVPAKFNATTYDNGTKAGVPQIEAPNAVIDASKIQSEIVDPGLYTKADICNKGVATSSTYCK